MDRTNNVAIDILVPLTLPSPPGGEGRVRGGRGGPAPFAFPDPAQASEEIDQVRVVTLTQLIQLKLAACRYADFADVVSLIRIHDLDELFAGRLHPGVRADYIECLEEKRREDDYKRREEIG